MKNLDFNSMAYVWRQAELILYMHVCANAPVDCPLPYPPNHNIDAFSKDLICSRTQVIYDYLLENSPELHARLVYVLHMHLQESESVEPIDATTATTLHVEPFLDYSDYLGLRDNIQNATHHFVGIPNNPTTWDDLARVTASFYEDVVNTTNTGASIKTGTLECRPLNKNDTLMDVMSVFERVPLTYRDAYAISKTTALYDTIKITPPADMVKCEIASAIEDD